MSKRKPKSKASKPFTISIHGDGIDIDAKFADSPNASGVVSELVERLHSSIAQPAVGVAPSSVRVAPDGLVELISDFGKSIAPDQLKTLTAALTPVQLIQFMQIMEMAIHPPQKPSDGAADHPHASS